VRLAVALAVALALAVHGTAGHLYSMRRLFFEGRGGHRGVKI
jgi:hypothetical protein